MQEDTKGLVSKMFLSVFYKYKNLDLLTLTQIFIVYKIVYLKLINTYLL